MEYEMEDIPDYEDHQFQKQKFFLIEAPENVINNAQKGRYWKTFSNICKKLNEAKEQQYEVFIFFRCRSNNSFKGCGRQKEMGYLIENTADERKACYLVEIEWVFKTEINIRDVNDIIHQVDAATNAERIQQGSVLYHKIGQRILNFGKQQQLQQNSKQKIRQQSMQQKYKMRSPQIQNNRFGSNQSNVSSKPYQDPRELNQYMHYSSSSGGANMDLSLNNQNGNTNRSNRSNSNTNNQSVQQASHQHTEIQETQNYKDVSRSKDSSANAQVIQKVFRGNQEMANEYEDEIKRLKAEITKQNQVIENLQNKQIIEAQFYEIKFLKMEQQLKDYQEILKKNDFKDQIKQNIEKTYSKILDDDKIDQILKENIIKNELQLKLLEDLSTNSSKVNTKLNNNLRILSFVPNNFYTESEFIKKGGFAAIFKGTLKKPRSIEQNVKQVMAQQNMRMSEAVQNPMQYENYNEVSSNNMIEEECVIKKFNVNLENMEQIKFFLHEILMLAKIPQHKNIIKVLGYSINYEELKNQSFKIMEKKLECKIFLEYAQEGNLHDFILKNQGFQNIRQKAQVEQNTQNLAMQAQQQAKLLDKELPINQSTNVPASESYKGFDDSFNQNIQKAQSQNINPAQVYDQGQNNIISSSSNNNNFLSNLSNVPMIQSGNQSRSGNLQVSQLSTNSSNKQFGLDQNLRSIKQIKLKMCIQITDGLMELHKNNIMHLDLKPDNILINKSWTAKITDFGISKQVEATKITSIIGQTIRYMPVEYQSEVVSHKTDIWSLGCIFYFIFSEQEPWAGCSNIQIAKRLSEKCDFFDHNRMDKCDLIMDILKHSLVHDHRKRWDALKINLELRKLLDQTQVTSQSI